MFLLMSGIPVISLASYEIDRYGRLSEFSRGRASLSLRILFRNAVIGLAVFTNGTRGESIQRLAENLTLWLVTLLLLTAFFGSISAERAGPSTRATHDNETPVLR